MLHLVEQECLAIEPCHSHLGIEIPCLQCGRGDVTNMESMAGPGLVGQRNGAILHDMSTYKWDG